MYDELVERLRETSNYFGELDHVSVMLLQAADAIEELATLQDSCKWIPVTERLPEEAGKYLVCGRWREKQTEIWVCEFMTFGRLKGWANNAANPFVSHWMPLPEPPKEE